MINMFIHSHSFLETYRQSLYPFSDQNAPQAPRDGVLRISSDRDDQRIFLGLKFSIPGFFCAVKFGKYSFVWLDLSGHLF